MTDAKPMTLRDAAQAALDAFDGEVRYARVCEALERALAAEPEPPHHLSLAAAWRAVGDAAAKAEPPQDAKAWLGRAMQVHAHLSSLHADAAEAVEREALAVWRERDDLRAECSALETECDGLRDKLEDAERDKDVLGTKLANYVDKLAAAERERDAARARLDELLCDGCGIHHRPGVNTLCPHTVGKEVLAAKLSAIDHGVDYDGPPNRDAQIAALRAQVAELTADRDHWRDEMREWRRALLEQLSGRGR